MNEEDDSASPPEQRANYSDTKPLRLSSSPPMWNDRARGMRGGGGSSLAPKAPYYISGAILLVAIVIVAFAFFGKGDDKAKQPTIVAQPTAVAQPDGQPVVAAPAGPAGNPVEAVSAAVMRTLAKPLIEDCTKADPGRDAGKLCATARGEREGRRAYAVGPIAGAPTHWFIVESQGGQWVVSQTISLTPDNAGVPGVPWPLRVGADVVVVGAAPCVNVREGPGLNQKAVDCIRDGTRIKLTAGPTNADNIVWWQVEGRTGWVAADYLRYPDAAQ
jgi:hypothetical protein